MGEESEDAEAVVDGYEDDAMIDERAVFVESARCGAAFIGAAVNPEHDGKGLGDGPLGNDDVEEEAIFLAGFGIVAVPVAKIGLRTGSAKWLVRYERRSRALRAAVRRQRRSPIGGSA